MLIDRYVAGMTLRHFGQALAALLAVFTVVNLTEELRAVGSADWGIRQALWFVVLTLPSQAYELFPAAALLGAVLAFGRMAADGEIVAFQAAGVSRARLTGAALLAAGVLAVLGAGFGETLAAPLSQRARTQRALALAGGRALGTTAGLWLRDGRRFANVGALRPDGSLGDLYLFDFDDERRLTRFVHAASATRSGDAWEIHDVRESTFARDVSDNRTLATASWSTTLAPRQIRSLWLEPRDLSLVELWRTIRSLDEHGQNPLGYEVSFWRRVTAPVYMGVMVLLAVPMVMVGGRTVRLGERATLGALVGLGFQMSQAMFTNLGLVAGFPPLLTALVPVLLALAAIGMLLRREALR